MPKGCEAKNVLKKKKQVNWLVLHSDANKQQQWGKDTMFLFFKHISCIIGWYFSSYIGPAASSQVPNKKIKTQQTTIEPSGEGF